MKKTSLLICIILLMACAAKKSAFTNADVDRAKTKFPGSTKATLSQGHDYYMQYCGNCHPFKSPSLKNEEQWKKIVPKMVEKTNTKANMEVINSKQEKLILAYLVTMCTVPAPQK